MPEQNPLDPLAAPFDQIIDAHREVLLPDGRKLLATERNALTAFAHANGRRARRVWRRVTIDDQGRVTAADFRWSISTSDDISALAPCTHIQTLFLPGNGISDISALAGFRELLELDLNGNDLRNISALASCQSLERLFLCRNRIPDIAPLAACPRLKHLDLRSNRITDVSPLASCCMLEHVDLSFNFRLSDLSAFESCPRLRLLDVLGNHLSEAATALIPKLQARGVVVVRSSY